MTSLPRCVVSGMLTRKLLNPEAGTEKEKKSLVSEVFLSLARNLSQIIFFSENDYSVQYPPVIIIIA